ncbi:rRNA adenine N-6-methyltransferase family protein [Rossellomorea sp. DA94]|uniref:class I SAM-dependent methyltransferase n=1 Tax=Rossellomorea sp. DA94 TaxID=3038653 RepID=UPI00244D6A7D|nr:rRNA adenine N-6-methyltransferase family protein [Rossellomorea sp. DA94]WGG46571.1 rRNA adenine N-6-methyltransferase family protein [Rossellomorea sp. DA94]
MKSTAFFLQYVLFPRKTGAVLPSSDYLAEKMVESVQFQTARCIVEYGAGTGVFTEKILKYRKSETIILVFESNQAFYELLQEKYEKEPNLVILNDTAENIEHYLKVYGLTSIDYVISGLPFASLPKPVSNAILNKTRNSLKADGAFITFQYSLLKKALFDQYFDDIDVTREYRNVPPAYVLCCRNEK